MSREIQKNILDLKVYNGIGNISYRSQLRLTN